MNSTSPAIETDSASPIGMPPGRLWGAYFREARYECLRTLRMPSFGLPLLLLPVALYLLFAVVLFGNAARSDPNTGAFMFAAFSVLGVMGPGMFGFGVIVAMERDQGLLTLKRALPVPAGAYLLAKMFMTMLFAAMVMATMIAAAATVGHLQLGVGQFMALAAINILGSLPFAAIGLFIGVRASARSAPAFVNIVYQFMMHLSGLFYPLPKLMQTIAPVWPTHHLQQLVLEAAGAPARGSAVVHVAVLALVTLLFTWLAVRRLARVG